MRYGTKSQEMKDIEANAKLSWNILSFQDRCLVIGQFMEFE